MRKVIGTVGAALALTIAAAGCGSDDDYANEPRPAAPINVTASIDKNRVSVSPSSFGAGPIVLIVSNITDDAQTVTLETGSGSKTAGIKQSTAPISPQGTGTLKIDVDDEGTYTVRVKGDRIKPATLTVGPPRPSSQNDLLQP